VRGELRLARCWSLRSLPKGLKVGQALDLRGALKWDGRIPDDAKASGMIRTPAHSNKEEVTLAQWRETHPEGEGFVS
jgi:hypothetical protein